MTIQLTVDRATLPDRLLPQIVAMVRRQRENAQTLAGKDPTRVEQARIETLQLIETQLSEIRVQG